jgi:hypothetical protein
MHRMQIPVLFIIFNRPDTTKIVFEAIREAKPKKLFVAADGPRKNKDGENQLCNEARKFATDIDWDCELKTLFRDENRGCGVGPSEAMTWFFSQVEEGIILEDDCLPNLSFFTFCEELLEKYKNDEKVMHIGGTNSQFGKKRNKYSYYFSKYPHIWGWATWKRAWQKFNYSFNQVDERQVDEIFSYYNFTPKEKEYWRRHWELIKDGNRKDIWDIQWTFSCWLNHGVTIVPNYNLISNIGFNSNATHTKMEDSKLGNLKTFELSAIKHPQKININQKADQYTFSNYNLLKSSFLNEFKSILAKLIPVGLKNAIKRKLFYD